MVDIFLKIYFKIIVIITVFVCSNSFDSVQASSVLRKSARGESADWLMTHKAASPLFSYIPEFYDDDVKIKLDQREQTPSYLTRFQFDTQGTATYSKHNFTDLVDKYESVDSGLEFKFTYWLNEKKTLSPFLSIVPNFSSHTDFDFQDFSEVRTGIQWYPFPDNKKMPFLKSVRGYVQYSDKEMHGLAKPEYVTDPALSSLDNDTARALFDKNNQPPKAHDVQIGFDYYYDTIFSGNPMAFSVWSSLAWYKTNFSHINPVEDRGQKYSAVIFKADVKYGPAKRWRDALVFPYISANWTYSPRYEERWFENYLRIGAGVRFYPFAFNGDDDSPVLWKNLMKRFHVFGECLYNAWWLGDEPTSSVSDTDFRIGLGYSTSGFFREDVK